MRIWKSFNIFNYFRRNFPIIKKMFNKICKILSIIPSCSWRKVTTYNTVLFFSIAIYAVFLLTSSITLCCIYLHNFCKKTKLKKIFLKKFYLKFFFCKNVLKICRPMPPLQIWRSRHVPSAPIGKSATATTVSYTHLTLPTIYSV